MKVIEAAGVVLLVVTWLPGIVLAKGFWSTAVAICVPPYAWYLLTERLMQLSGLL